MKDLIAGIMCGGAGKRLWPLSQESKPKQLLKLIGNQSSLQRIISIINKSNIDVTLIGNKIHRNEIIEQTSSEKLHFNTAIWENEGRNTAFAISSFAHKVKKENGENAVIVIIPSDQYWGDENVLIKGLEKISNYARKNNKIVCVGVKPQFASSDYGYVFIHQKSNQKRKKESIKKIEKFCEKPSVEIANHYIQNNNCFWNSGIYCAKAKVFLNEIRKHAPEVFFESQKLVERAMNDNEKNNNREIFLQVHDVDIPNQKINFKLLDDIKVYLNKSFDSIDKAVIEKCQNNVVCLDLGDVVWEDIGSFIGLTRASQHSPNQENITMINTCNSYAYSDEKPLYVLGADNIVILNLSDKIIVMDQKYADQIKRNNYLPLTKVNDNTIIMKNFTDPKILSKIASLKISDI
ncbi:sugar phosphate nucleotidyltransferase [Lyticum sinuosum]|uniref:Glycosyltransferase family A n=1 Tax=Lyticum sinuosum TaxID=1332059 RepID=A0AAE4VM90_9RICK|nr:sugar phosphate nucleotidyltransferase [Lyticum sinuosum]MDZ5761546.1 Glycosyltransferase family A [Lyticum sinuosum]